MLNYRSLLIIILLLLSGVATAQEVYYTTQNRPAGMNWQELNTPHFRVIFPAGYDSVAYLTARILEDQYPVTKALTGGDLTRFPVVITDYNDDTNGFVTSLNFRSEFDLAPLKARPSIPPPVRGSKLCSRMSCSTPITPTSTTKAPSDIIFAFFRPIWPAPSTSFHRRECMKGSPCIMRPKTSVNMAVGVITATSTINLMRE